MSDEEPKPKIGRPSEYTQEKADIICAHLCNGLSLRSITKLEGMPCMETIMRWLRLHPEFKDQYARAKDEQMDAYAEEIVDIADDATNDFMEIENKNGGTTVIFDKENIQRSKLRIEARQWMMGKLRPKKYGNNVIKVENQQLDKDGNPTDPAGSRTDAVLASALEAMKQVKDDTSTEEDAS